MLDKEKSIEEIAQVSGVDTSYAYKLLDEIATYHEKKRDDYIRGNSYKKGVVVGQNHNSYIHFQTADVEKIIDGYKKAIAQVDNLQEEISRAWEEAKKREIFEEDNI